MLAHGLAVGAYRAGELSVGWHGASGQVIVIARGLQLQQLEVLARGKQGRVYVAKITSALATCSRVMASALV